MVAVFSKHAETYLQGCADKYGVSLEEYKKMNNKSYEIEMARKYLKVWYKSNGNQSIVMFIDEAGNIYKPASHKAPAKGVRGTINEWQKAVSVHKNMSIVSVN